MAPVASSSRRTRRQPSDAISEDPVTQRNKAEDVEIDSGDDATRHRGSRKEKRSKKKPAAPAGRDETMIDADLDTADVPDEPFDREALLNQPLSQKQLAKLHALAMDATVLLNVYKMDAMEMSTRLAGNVAEFMGNSQDKVYPGKVLSLRSELTRYLGSRGTGPHDEDPHGCRAISLHAEGCRLVVAREAYQRREDCTLLPCEISIPGLKWWSC